MSNPPSDLADREKASGVMAEEENETGYPPRKVVLPAMGAIALAVFLIALVWHSYLNLSKVRYH